MSHASTYDFLHELTCQLNAGRTPAEVLGGLARDDHERAQASACARRATCLTTGKQFTRNQCPDDGD